MEEHKAQQPYSRQKIRRDIALVLIFKVIALSLIWSLFFSDSHRPDASTASVGRVLTGNVAGRAQNTAADRELK
jgi:uncharacterized membrane protein